MTLGDATLRDLRAIAPRLIHLIDHFDQARVLVVGDLMVDEFITGEVERTSREAPVLILRHESTRHVPGGGANAAYNLASLGATVSVVGLMGHDEQGRSLQQLFAAAHINTYGVHIDPNRPTVTKTRISGHARQSVTQQIVRVDRKPNHRPTPTQQQQLAQTVQQHVSSVDAVICSDYGDGVLMPPVIAASLHHPCTIVDTQGPLACYAGAQVFTPNLPEAEHTVGYPIETMDDLHRAGNDLLALTQAACILITRGEDGIALFERDAPPQVIPAFNRTDVFDVTGAGDTVVAAMTLGLVAGATFWEAALLGNLAASLVVRQFGTTTTTPHEMKTALARLLQLPEPEG